MSDIWKIYSEIDFADEAIKQYHIDTRDFHCSTVEEVHELDLRKLIKYKDNFFHTPDEVVSLLNRLYIESNGDAKWRYLSLKGVNGGWDMKYIRIFRTELGLLVCNRDSHAMNKEKLSAEIDKTYLYAH